MMEDERKAVGQMLPGVAAICLFMLFLTLANVFGALHNTFGIGLEKYGVLGLCTLLVAGIFGLLRMRRWGWALVLAGCLMLFSGDFFFFEKTHRGFFLIRGMFSLVFFLYLVRAEVRSRLR
jgi:multisubunit Na+/H+ antiporter MnhB subunit